MQESTTTNQYLCVGSLHWFLGAALNQGTFVHGYSLIVTHLGKLIKTILIDFGRFVVGSWSVLIGFWPVLVGSCFIKRGNCSETSQQRTCIGQRTKRLVPNVTAFIKFSPNSGHLSITDKFFKTCRCPLFRGFTVITNRLFAISNKCICKMTRLNLGQFGSSFLS